MALITDEFREKILSEYIDKNKVMLEEATAKVKRFALGFEIDGDVSALLDSLLRSPV